MSDIESRGYDNDKPAFEIKDMDTGQTWRIWADGKIEGFPEKTGIIVTNRIPGFVSMAWAQGRDAGIKEYAKASEGRD